MRTEDEYDELRRELRNEIGARHGLDQDAIDIIPVNAPSVMRAHIARLAKSLGAEPAPLGNNGEGSASTDDKADLGKAINKRLDTILDARYPGPTLRK